MATASSMASLSLADGKDGEFSARTVTGVLASRPTARDIKIDGFSLGLNGCVPAVLRSSYTSQLLSPYIWLMA